MSFHSSASSSPSSGSASLESHSTDSELPSPQIKDNPSITINLASQPSSPESSLESSPRASPEGSSDSTPLSSPELAHHEAPSELPQAHPVAPRAPSPVPLPSTIDGRTMLQVINEHQVFSSELTLFMDEVWNLGDVGFNYNLVAVFGSQSTGKSTLLNTLFGTEFTTMSDELRQQTTRGLWVALASDSNTLVMDVEGVDGRERGEDQDFERKSALFSLAVSQVVLVNIWENQVGLYNGANMGLLKTVFEVNLELFQHKGKGKTLLFFVIRDHLGKSPLAHLSQTLKKDLQKIWVDLAKPKGLEDCTITDFFDFMFFGLPHRVLLPDEFEEQAQVLSHCFYDPTHPNYVFRPQYHKRIPADGLQRYAANIWEQIVTNKNLDLPTQQQLLAQFRCDEIAASQFDEMVSKFSPHRETIESGELIDNLGTVFNELEDFALAHFDGQAGRYNPAVYKKKRQGLVTKIEDYFHAYFKTQLTGLARKYLDDFSSTMKDGLSRPKYDFVNLVKETTGEITKKFEKGSSDMMLQNAKWSRSKETKEFKKEIDAQTQILRHVELAKYEGQLSVDILDRYEEDLSASFRHPGSEFWHTVLESFAGASTDASNAMKKRAEDFELPPKEIKTRVADIRVRAWEVLIQKLKEEVSSEAMLLAKLRQRLEEQFRYDSNGLPRVWLPDDDIDAHFQTGKTDALELLPLLSRVNISYDPVGFNDYFNDTTREIDFKKSLVLVGPGKQAELESRFKRESDALFLEAKRSVVSITSKIPYWMLILLLLLGWNEILYMLYSPLTLVLVLIVGAGLYAVYALKLAGPLLRVIDVIGNEIYRQVSLALEDTPAGAQFSYFTKGIKEEPNGTASSPSRARQSNLSNGHSGTMPGSGDFED